MEEIAAKLELQPITVRHHLQALMEAGIVEYYEERSGTVGRPRAYYRIVKTPPTTSFPRRQYQFLSEFMINAIVKMFGNRATPFLKDIGIQMGEDTIRKLESEYNIKSWTAKEYGEYFIGKYLEKEGTEPEIIEMTDNRIVYRMHNCLFFELATKMPHVMCDVLHESFHDGVAKAIGRDLKMSRTTCMGHGDPYCEHICVWAPESK